LRNTDIMVNVTLLVVLLRCQDLATRFVAVVFWTHHRCGSGLQCSRHTAKLISRTWKHPHAAKLSEDLPAEQRL